MTQTHSSGHAKDYSELDPRLTPFYESGERVEITWKEGMGDYTGYGDKSDGRKARYFIGRSTGWKPIYIGLVTRKQDGGPAIDGSMIESVRGMGEYRDEEPEKAPNLPVLDAEGNLPEVIIGTPCYHTDRGLCICGYCANDEESKSYLKVVSASVNFNDDDLYCDNCGNAINPQTTY